MEYIKFLIIFAAFIIGVVLFEDKENKIPGKKIGIASIVAVVGWVIMYIVLYYGTLVTMNMNLLSDYAAGVVFEVVIPVIYSIVVIIVEAKVLGSKGVLKPWIWAIVVVCIGIASGLEYVCIQMVHQQIAQFTNGNFFEAFAGNSGLTKVVCTLKSFFVMIPIIAPAISYLMFTKENKSI